MVYYELHSYSAIHVDKAKKTHNIIAKLAINTRNISYLVKYAWKKKFAWLDSEREMK